MDQLKAAISAYDAQDFEKAFALLMKPSDDGNAEAQAMIGTMYQLGLGVDQDQEMAIDFYTMASAKGHAVASNNLAGLMKDHPGISSQYYKLAQEQGFVHTLIQKEAQSERIGQPG